MWKWTWSKVLLNWPVMCFNGLAWSMIWKGPSVQPENQWPLQRPETWMHERDFQFLDFPNFLLIIFLKHPLLWGIYIVYNPYDTVIIPIWSTTNRWYIHIHLDLLPTSKEAIMVVTDLNPDPTVFSWEPGMYHSVVWWCTGCAKIRTGK